MPVPLTPVAPETVEEIIPSHSKHGTLCIVLRLCAVTSINPVSPVHATSVQFDLRNVLYSILVFQRRSNFVGELT